MLEFCLFNLRYKLLFTIFRLPRCRQMAYQTYIATYQHLPNWNCGMEYRCLLDQKITAPQISCQCTPTVPRHQRMSRFRCQRNWNLCVLQSWIWKEKTVNRAKWLIQACSSLYSLKWLNLKDPDPWYDVCQSLMISFPKWRYTFTHPTCKSVA